MRSFLTACRRGAKVSWQSGILPLQIVLAIFSAVSLVTSPWTLSAIDNVLLPVIPDGIRKADRERAQMLLEKVGLGDRASHRPKELSGGEKQRVAIARALIQSPEIIFADEPTGNLDTTTGEDIIKLLRELNQSMGITVVIVTHDTMIMEKVDLVLNMRDGGIHIP